MSQKYIVAIAGIAGAAIVACAALAIMAYVALHSTLSVDQASPAGTAAMSNPCPPVSTLDPRAFAGYPAGSCVTLVSPAAMSPQPHIWCPAGADLPLAGNALMLIGEYRALLQREGDTFRVVGPEGVSAAPLEHRDGDVVSDGVSLFREQGNGRYTCLVDTLVSIP